MSKTYRKGDPLWGGLVKEKDGKPYYKPTSAFKKVNRQKRRAKEHQALVKLKDIPLFKKTDQWDWL